MTANSLETTSQAIEEFLATNQKTKNSFAYELFQELGAEAFLELMKRFSGKTVKFPSEEAFKTFLIGKTKRQQLEITEVFINV